MSDVALHLGDCLDVLRAMPDNSVDSVVTDPPYGLSFMGKAWDGSVPGPDMWAEVLRVLKPGGYLLAFAGTRTQHRMAVAIEDAGFEIRDMIAWVYGSGFPKSHNLKEEWSGWGTALKPALEPITVARKPLTGTVAANVLEWGTGAINVDGARVPTCEMITATRNIALGSSASGVYGAANVQGVYQQKPGGRWPANLIHDGSFEVTELFPGEAEKSAARFFYCPKASKRDRDDGLEGFEKRNNMRVNAPRESEGAKHAAVFANTHPTVKPTDLMRYLCRLVTPPGGLVLDPFMGSGSTGRGAVMEGFQFVGIEMDAQYLEIARARIKAVQGERQELQQLNLFEERDNA